MANLSEIKSILKDLSLNGKQVSVFIALLKAGSLTATGIADETGITRTHVYDIAEELKKKGLVTESKIRNVKYYSSLNHSELMTYVATKQSELSLLEKRLESAGDIFKSVQANETSTTKVRFHDGMEGMKSVYEEIRADLERTKGSKELLTYWPTEGLEKAYPKFFEKERYFDMPALIKRDIMCDAKATQKYVDAYKESPTTHSFRTWPKAKGEFPTDVEIWGNKVAFTDVRDKPSGIIIENKSVADSMRMWFEHIWESLPET